MSYDQIVQERPGARSPAWEVEPVEVRRGPPGGAAGGAAVLGAPEQILRAGALWVARRAERLPMPTGSVPGGAVEQWQVSAGQGLTGPQGSFVLSRDEDDRWWLREAVR